MTPEQTKLAELVDEVYALPELPLPRRYYFVDSPWAGVLAVALLKQWYTTDDTQDEVPADENLSAGDLEAAVMAIQQTGRIPADLLKDAQDAPVWSMGAATVFLYDRAESNVAVSLGTHPDGPAHLDWYWPMQEVVVVCMPPTQVWLDQDQRLHHDTEPAVQYRDGTGFYFDHGSVVHTGRPLDEFLIAGLMQTLGDLLGRTKRSA